LAQLCQMHVMCLLTASHESSRDARLPSSGGPCRCCAEGEPESRRFRGPWRARPHTSTSSEVAHRLRGTTRAGRSGTVKPVTIRMALNGRPVARTPHGAAYICRTPYRSRIDPARSASTRIAETVMAPEDPKKFAPMMSSNNPLQANEPPAGLGRRPRLR
jgi:hypothetical protein